MKVLALLALALIPIQEKNEAEELFKKMEEKFATAKSARLKMTGELKAADMTLSGEYALSEGSRMRVDLEGKQGATTHTARFTCNGERIRMEESGKEAKEFKSSETLGKSARLLFARCGFLGTLDCMNSDYEIKNLEKGLMTASAFKLGAKEKVGDRPAQVIEYRLSPKHENGEGTDVVAWIDTETTLPLKRTFKMGPMTLSESYADVKIDEKIDPAKFELPK